MGPVRLSLLSQTAEHALRAVLYLATNGDRGFVPAAEAAEALGAPSNYLSKTLRLLVRKGFLRSSRGPRGGFQLAVDAEHLTAAQIVEAVGDGTTRSNCLMGSGPCDPDAPCAAHEQWEALTRRVLGPMERTTVADLLGGAASGPPATH
jgi:Rrf2 family protein